MTEDRSAEDTYKHVLNVVEYNTGDPQPCGLKWSTLLTIATSHGPDDPDDVRTAIRVAENNGDLLGWTDADGRTRLTRTDDEEMLRVLVQRLVNREDPDREAIGEANAHLEDLK